MPSAQISRCVLALKKDGVGVKTVNEIKLSVKRLFETKPQIHVNVTISHPKVSVRNSAATITAVYPNVFRIEENDCGYPRSHTLQYSDVLTGKVEISELFD